MGKTYIKTIIREIGQSFGRFFAIFAIVALGVGFLAGLLVSTPNMKLSVDDYYKEHNMTDIFIKGNLGLTEDDYKEIAKIKEVEHIMPAYVTDALMENQDQDIFTSRIYGLPLDDLNTKDSQFINQLELVEGRMPRADHECLVERSGDFIREMEIGSTLTIVEEDEDKKDELEDTYKNTEYTVVGVVSNPFYFSKERESSSKGDGRLSAIVYIHEDNYDLDVYTDLYIKAAGAEALQSFTDEYETYVEGIAKKIEDIGKVRSRIRYRDVIEEASESLDYAKDQYEAAEKKAYKELDDALKTLERARVEIRKAEDEVSGGDNELFNSQLDLTKEKEAFVKQIRAQEAEFEKGQSELNNARQALVGAQSFIGIHEFNAGMNDILAKESELLSGKALLETKKKEAKAQFQEAQLQIDQAKLEIEQGQSDLKLAKEELAKGEADYRRAKSQVEEELEDADFKITEAEEEIN